MESESNTTESRTAEVLICEMERKQHKGCRDCRAGLCSHQVLMNIAMGFGDKPRCLACLAAALERPVDGLRQSLIAYLQQKECHRVAWEWADRNERVTMDGMRVCLNAYEGGSQNTVAFSNNVEPDETRGPLAADAEWDAGDMGCGELVLELRVRLQAMNGGEIMKLCATDPGAPEDLPAWCRLTGHALLRGEHPNYWIQRRR